MYRIAIAGASTLLGKELKDALLDSPFAAASITLYDDEQAIDQLDQLGDEVTFINRIQADTFEQVDFTFFAGPPTLTSQHWRQALRSGSSVIDLSGALDQEPGVLVCAPWLTSVNAFEADLFTPAVVPADPAALGLALILERITKVARLRFAAATVMQPASEFGRAAMDELHQQTVRLLSFQTLPRAVFDAQVAYNQISSFGEAATINLAAAETRTRQHYNRLADSKCLSPLAIQFIQSPVFHGHTFSIALELEQPIALNKLEDALSDEHIDLILEDTDSPSNLTATGQNDVLVRIRPEANPKGVQRLWIWAATDNLRLNVFNAIECALDLRRLRPQGKVQ